jgi:hypothetical protein
MRVFFLALLYVSALNARSTPELIYREAERLENRLLLAPALAKYQEVLKSKNRLWNRRAAYRIANLIKNIHFTAGRSESVRPSIISLYKSLLYDIGGAQHDPELWGELRKEIRWTRLGLQSPPMLF